tara:strand:- start:3938 stop:4843 length:906 start_codon:yes stop_codon:yes gene_type:complete
MAKKNAQKKENKEISKKAKKIKEKIMNKVEDQIEKEQIKDQEMDQKNTQTIDPEITEKQPENGVEDTTMEDVGTDQLVDVLRIPMQDAKSDHEDTDVHSAVFDSEEEEEEEDRENLNDRYFDDEDKRSKEDDFDSEFFDDEKLMAEMGVEIIDLGMQTLAMGIAQDFDNPEKYAVSDYKKNKIKKPLELLLRKRGAKVSPEVMFGVVLLVVYAPTMILAINERKAKMKAKRNPQPDPADQIPDHIEEVDHEEMMSRSPRFQSQDLNAPKPMVVPKKKGRPKGSKDSKKRSTKGYKGNSNAK